MGVNEVTRQRDCAPGGAAVSGAAATAGSNERIVALLNALALRGSGSPWGVRELASSIGASSSTTGRLLLALAERHFTQQADGGTYRAGPRLRVLADRLHRHHPLLDQARPIIDALAERCDATAIVALHNAPHPRCFVALRTESPGPVRYDLAPGTELPLHAGAAGRSILTALGTEALADDLPEFTPDTVTDHAELGELLAQAREAGFTLSIGQHFALAAGVAVPFRFGGLLGAVSVTRPRYNTTEDDLLQLAPFVQGAARRIEELPHFPEKPVLDAAATSAGPREGGSAAARFEHLLSALVTSCGALPASRRGLANLLAATPATATKLRTTALESGLATARGEQVVAGPRLLHWAASLGTVGSTADLAHDILRSLAERTGETIGLTEYDNTAATARMTAVVPGANPIHYGLAAGVEIPLHAGAAGKAVLAHLPPEMLTKQELPRYTEHTPLNPDDIADQLRGVRERGWATADGERIPDAYGIAAPFFIDGTVGGSIDLTVPRYRTVDLDLRALGEQVSSAASELTRLLSAP